MWLACGATSALAAVDARTGATVWWTKRAAFALSARGDRLLAALPETPGKTGCGLALLDVGSGRILRSVSWPEGGPSGCVGEGIRMDLVSGKERWSRTVKDLSYRGPYPPAARTQ
ncbi:MAG: hypothetical protein AAB368_05300 [bacterium]